MFGALGIFQFKVISITKGSATTCFFYSRNAQLRHSEFEGYLHHCVKQYSLYGHGGLTSSLCSWADWNAWSKAVAGEAIAGVICLHMLFDSKICIYIY